MAKQLTLVEKAKRVKPRRVMTQEESAERIALAVAFASRELTASQCKEAMGCDRRNVYQQLGSVIIGAVRAGKVKIVYTE